MQPAVTAVAGNPLPVTRGGRPAAMSRSRTGPRTGPAHPAATRGGVTSGGMMCDGVVSCFMAGFLTKDSS